MADFLDKLSEAVKTNRGELERYLRKEAAPGETEIQRLVEDHWLPLPQSLEMDPAPAYAIDASISQIDLDNGSYLFVSQAQCIGVDACDERTVDVQVLPPATPRVTAGRFGDVLQRYREMDLATTMVAQRVPPGGVLYLDGALYGLLPQLYKTPIEDSVALQVYPEQVLLAYLDLMRTARERGVRIVAVSKTSREATHCKLWMRALDLDSRQLPPDLTDSGMIHRWTDGAAGISVPVVLGTWGFTGSTADLLEREDVRASPAIVSFFVRLADLDDALRIDVPAHQVGCDHCLGDLPGDVLDTGVDAILPVVRLLATDYGGSEVYNALLYSVDREVRLRREVAVGIYLPLIGEMLGCQLRPNRSERRFV